MSEEVTEEFFRTSGPGGQRRNRKATGVRLRHLPTGIVVTATERRSQAQNRALALDRLRAALARRRRRPKPRLPTRTPTRAKEARLRKKRIRKQTKALRRPVPKAEDNGVP